MFNLVLKHRAGGRPLETSTQTETQPGFGQYGIAEAGKCQHQAYLGSGLGFSLISFGHWAIHLSSCISKMGIMPIFCGCCKDESNAIY